MILPPIGAGGAYVSGWPLMPLGLVMSSLATVVLSDCLVIGALSPIGKGGAVPLGPSDEALDGNEPVAGDLHTDWLLGL